MDGIYVSKLDNFLTRKSSGQVIYMSVLKVNGLPLQESTLVCAKHSILIHRNITIHHMLDDLRDRSCDK